MSNMSGTQMAIYIIGIFVALFLLGMIGNNPEHFSDSSSEDVDSGASEKYNWGYNPIKDPNISNNDDSYVDPIYDKNVYIDKVNKLTSEKCRNCDITKNKDIDKYVLKSSIPPCPDMSEYAKKSQLPPAGFNPDEWIKKSDIPPCPVCPDLRNYVLKSEIPPCDTNKVCPKCPECPVCPTCPPCKPEIIKKVIYKEKKDRLGKYFPRIPKYLPQYAGENYPQSGHFWRPKLSDSTSGFVSPDVPMAGNLWMDRRRQELQAVQK